MENQVKTSVKIKALIALAMPILYFLMFLPLWNGNEIKIDKTIIINIIQIACFIFAAINLFLIFVRKEVKNQTVFTAVMVVSAILTCFFGIFFVEKLMGIPLLPPQN